MATSILEKIIEENRKNIFLEITGMDKKYGRLVGILYYKKGDEMVNINKEMGKTGLCPKYIYK